MISGIPVTSLKLSGVHCCREPGPVVPSQMIVNPVLASRAIFDQSLQDWPIAGPLATTEVVVVVLGGVVVGAGGGIDDAGAGAGRALADGGVGAGVFGAGARRT